MMEFLEADLFTLGLAHAIEFRSHNSIVAPSPFSGKKKADIGGDSPLKKPLNFNRRFFFFAETAASKPDPL